MRRRSSRDRISHQGPEAFAFKPDAPCLGAKRPLTARATVDLPLPDSPTSANVSPSFDGKGKFLDDIDWWRRPSATSSAADHSPSRSPSTDKIGSGKNVARPHSPMPGCRAHLNCRGCRASGGKRLHGPGHTRLENLDPRSHIRLRRNRSAAETGNPPAVGRA